MAVTVGVLGHGSLKDDREKAERFKERRIRAHVLRRFNRGVLEDDDGLKSIAKCCLALGSTVVYKRDRRGRIRPSGTATCKSVWGCLGCAARRRALKSAVVR